MPLTTSFEIPTWDAIVTRVSADFVTRLGEDSYIPRSWQWALVRVTAGVSYAVHGVAAFVARQVIADRSDEAGVKRHGKIFGWGPLPGTRATGAVDLPGINGTVVPAGTELVRADGWRYETDAEVTVAGGTCQPTFTSVDPGADGNAAAATALNPSTPIVGLYSQGLIFGAGATGGTDVEPIEDFRERFIERLRYPPHGGAAHDYVRWAREALETVDAVWVVKGAVEDGPPLAIDVPVTVYFTLEGEGAAVIPAAGNVTTVDAYLEPRAPEGAAPAATAPAGVAVDLTIDPTAAYDTAAQRDAVEAALHALFARKNRERQRDIFGAVAGVGTVTIRNSEIRTTIGSIMEGFTLDDVNADGTGLSDVALTAAQAAYLGTVTWVP